MFDKKGQGLSMNVIIIAAIALLILVILTTLVIQSGGKLGQTSSCSSVPGYQCIDEGDDCGQGYTHDTFKSCSQEDEKCCVPLGTSE